MPTKRLNIQINEKGASKAQNAMRGLGSSIAKTVTGYLALGTVGYKTISFFKESINLYKRQELAETKLRAALGYTSKELQRYASELQRNTIYGDEAILEAQALLGAFVKEESQLKRLTAATLDLAAAKGMDLKVAADLLGKAVGSSTNALARYGIEVKGAYGSTERLDTAVTNIGKLFGGQAAAQAKTYAGEMESIANSFGDAREKLGESIVALTHYSGLVKEIEFQVLRLNAAVTIINNELKNEEDIAWETVKAFIAKKRAMVALNAEMQKTPYQEWKEKLIETQKEQEKNIIYQNRFANEIMRSAKAAVDGAQVTVESFSYMAYGIDELGIKSTESSYKFNQLLGEIKKLPKLVDKSAEFGKERIDEMAQDWYKVGNKFTGMFSDSLRLMMETGQDVFQSLGDAFKAMVERMAAELLAKGIIFTFLSAFSPAVKAKGFMSFLGFQHGGSFTVPGGNSPTDNKIAQIPVRSGEKVNISTPEQSQSEGLTINVIVQGDLVDYQNLTRNTLIPMIKQDMRRGYI